MGLRKTYHSWSVRRQIVFWISLVVVSAITFFEGGINHSITKWIVPDTLGHVREELEPFLI